MTRIHELTATVHIEQGDLKGGISRTDNGREYFEFLDIPYAKPPVGELRFKVPEPPLPWTGVRDASKIDLNHYCCQYINEIQGTEDCMYLSVFVPKVSHESDNTFYPVVVFIHGGGFHDGNGTDKNVHGPDYFLENDIIVVSFNYRLGILGFLCLDIPQAAGNMALKDQVQALRWVQNNIERFGGDKNNVTLFGNSAGAAFVDYLILAPTAEGLFHKAILQSGCSLNHWCFDHGMNNLVTEILIDLEYNGSLDDNYEIYNFLKIQPVEILVEKSKILRKNLFPERLFFGFVPTIEKDFGDGTAIITKEPFQLYKEGRYNKVPVIRGCCERESFMTFGIKKDAWARLLKSESFLNPWPYKMSRQDEIRFNAAFFDAYFDKQLPKEQQYKIGLEFFNDFDIKAGITLISEIQAKDNVPVYLYEFSYDGKLNYLKYLHNINMPGATHADDLGYVIKFPCKIEPTDDDISVRNTVIKMLSHFAKTGCPTPKNDFLIQWPMFQVDSPLCLNINSTLSVKCYYKPKNMSIFREIYDRYLK